MKRFFLVDCNNFYVSCERVFNPKLNKKPVVVLGSNDACIIARSNEAKALGIAMGAPAFEHAALFKKHKVIVYSANFALYGDMSARVMKTLAEYSPDIEIYSVDEAFLHISPCNNPAGTQSDDPQYYTTYAHHIKKTVVQKTGIPVSIGIGPTKTLAKIANKLAKKNPVYAGVCDITDHPDIDSLLALVPIGDVWGIGHRYAQILENNNIKTARDFKYASDSWVKKTLTIVGLKTMLELRGITCLSLQTCPAPKESITVSRSFGKKITDQLSAQQALASYVTCAAEKLRAQQCLTGHITVFALAHRYHDPHYHFLSTSMSLQTPIDYSPHLITAANQCLEKIFKIGLTYKKVGIILTDFMPREFRQMAIAPTEIHTPKQDAIMHTLDQINTKWGRNKLFFAAAGIEQPWKMYQAHKSACFTTNWQELITITL